MYDVVVIGAGAGGLHAAARLSHAGKRVLLVDANDRLGGRATTREIDGFKVNEGAIALEFGGAFQETFDLVGAPFDVRRPAMGATFRIGGKTVDASKGGWGMLLGGITKHAAKVGASFAGARRGELPDEQLSTAAWLSRMTRNKTVHRMFRNLCGVIFSGNADEVPARTFLIYLATKGAFKDFGFCPQGTIGVWNALGAAIEAKGGDIWLSSSVEKIHMENGVATGVSIRRDGREPVHVATRAVVSNAGPAKTIDLAGPGAFDEAYVERVRRTLRPAAIIVVNFTTQRPLIELPSLTTFADTRRLCTLGEMTATCPEMAPPGWKLYVAYAVPCPAIADFDEAAEVELTKQDLRNELPGFNDARILSVRVMRGDWPGQRSLAGYDVEPHTSIANVWNVGDAVKPDGEAGTQSCAETARNVSHQVVALLDRQPSRASELVEG